jgi:hypothetical protein
MALTEVICGSCGAINRASADTCWRCLEPIVEPAAAPARTAAAPHLARPRSRTRTAPRRSWPAVDGAAHRGA